MKRKRLPRGIRERPTFKRSPSFAASELNLTGPFCQRAPAYVLWRGSALSLAAVVPASDTGVHRGSARYALNWEVNRWENSIARAGL
jgi:hypothetical protein